MSHLLEALARNPRSRLGGPGIGATARPARRGVQACMVGALLPTVTRKAFERYGFSVAALLTDWAVVAGRDIASFTMPERLKWPRLQGAAAEAIDEGAPRPGATLILRVDGPRALELEHRRNEVLERINTYFGYRAVTELKLVQAPIARSGATPAMVTAGRAGADPSPIAEVEAIADESLKAAFNRLHRGVATGGGRPARGV